MHTYIQIFKRILVGKRLYLHVFDTYMSPSQAEDSWRCCWNNLLPLVVGGGVFCRIMTPRVRFFLRLVVDGRMLPPVAVDTVAGSSDTMMRPGIAQQQSSSFIVVFLLLLLPEDDAAVVSMLLKLLLLVLNVKSSIETIRWKEGITDAGGVMLWQLLMAACVRALSIVIGYLEICFLRVVNGIAVLQKTCQFFRAVTCLSFRRMGTKGTSNHLLSLVSSKKPSGFPAV